VSRRAPYRLAAVLLAPALAVALAACGTSGGRPVAGGTRPAGGVRARAGSGPAASPAAAPLRVRVRADVLVVAAHALPAATVAKLRKVAPRGVTTFGYGHVAYGGKPLAVAAVDPSKFRAFAPRGTAEADGVWDAVARGDLVLAHDVAGKRHAALGATVTLRRTPLRLAALATTGLPDTGALVSRAVGDALGVPHGNAVLLTAGRGDPVALATAARKVAGRAAVIHLLTQPKVPYAYLTGSAAARAFGAFSYRWYDDGTIEPDARWVRANIVRGRVPILGAVTCHRLMLPQLRRALADVQAAGLGALIHSYDGCYVPRFIERDPSHPVSLHTWGIAIDLDASTNQRGGRGTMDARIVAIFKRWGFRWGGDWSYTDPMHFELGAVMTGV
jgi:hypothetical protein